MPTGELVQTHFSNLPLGAIFTFAKGREPTRFKDGVGSHTTLSGTGIRGVTAAQNLKPVFWRNRVGRYNETTGRIE